ncbi:hypothetical protein QTO34_003681 [Cnephaeus nilssonii]|uniref:Uncharacterized protein n=1 Tax=Cnephaeus nilssonii TaxID=3371016 RepID=A0AA40LKS0_CNENI|nr:hypothetical protein QTO34_003681 [Eptesicus nilssonii]
MAWESVLQSPLENQPQGVSPLPPSLPEGTNEEECPAEPSGEAASGYVAASTIAAEGANEEVNDGVGTAVDTGHGYYKLGFPRKAFSMFIHLRSVLQSPLENQPQRVSLLPPSLPEGANEEVNDGIGTAVDIGQKCYNHGKMKEGIRFIWKPDYEEPVDAKGQATEQEDQYRDHDGHVEPGRRHPVGATQQSAHQGQVGPREKHK